MTTRLLQQRPLLLSLFAGFIGFLLNYVHIPLFTNEYLVIGNISYIIITALLGPMYGLLAAVVAVTSLALQWQTPLVYLLYGFEALLLGFATQRHYRISYISILYWALIGSPIAYAYIVITSSNGDNYALFTIYKMLANSMLYTTIAALIIFLFQTTARLAGKKIPSPKRHFHEQLFHNFFLLLSISLLICTLVFNYFSIYKQQKLLDRRLTDASQHLGKALEEYLKYNSTMIANTAEIISTRSLDPNQIQPLITRLQDKNPDFMLLQIVSADGNVIFSSDANSYHKNIAKKAYFNDDILSNNDLISKAYTDIDYGNKPFVIMSKPITGINAFLLGYIDTEQFKLHEQNFMLDQKHLVVLTDENLRVLDSSKELNLRPLSQFHYLDITQNAHTIVPLMNIKDLSSNEPEYVYTKYQTRNGSQIFILTDYLSLIQVVEGQFLFAFSLLVLFILFSLFVAKGISRRLTTPLNLITSQINNGNILYDNKINKCGFSTIEVQQLYEELLKNQKQLYEYQEELEQKVLVRTQALEQANIKLKVLAETDPLTQLANRRHAEISFITLLGLCQRQKKPMAVVLIDLDFFKQINDEYGHLGGDEVLRDVSRLLKKFFKRDADLLARYGGEELLLIHAMCNVSLLQDYLETVRKAIESLVIINPEDNRQIKVTASFGAVISSSHYSQDLDAYLKKADANLYQAKAEGRNRVICTVEIS